MKQHVALFTLLILLGAGCTTTPATSSPAATSNTLDLHGRGLTSVSSSVFENTALEELNLSDNMLTGALPGEIRHLSNLRVLDASDNQMTGVPAEIGQLSRLEVLDLSNNALTGLPNELGNLTSLRQFDLRGNNVSQQDLEGIRAKPPNTDILVD